MSVAKAIQNVDLYKARWTTSRVSRRLDDRDFVLAEAIQLLEEHAAEALPTITRIRGFGPDSGEFQSGDVDVDETKTDVVITVGGVGVLVSNTFSTGSTSSSSGEILLTAVIPGEVAVVVTITDSSEALAVSADASIGTIAVAVGDAAGAGTGGAYTATEVVAAINADATAKFMVEASVTTAGDMDADESFDVDGGSGEPLSLIIGAISHDGTVSGCGITAVDSSASTITFDCDASQLGEAGDVVPVYLRTEGVLCPVMSLTLSS